MAKLTAEQKLGSFLRETTDTSILDRALIRLYGKQTVAERSTKRTFRRNGRGFDRNMAPTMSQFAELLLDGKLTNKHRRMLRHILPSYSTQLRDLALEIGLLDDIGYRHVG